MTTPSAAATQRNVTFAVTPMPPAETWAKTLAKTTTGGRDATWVSYYDNFFQNDPRWTDATTCYTHFKNLP